MVVTDVANSEKDFIGKYSRLILHSLKKALIKYWWTV